MAAKGWIELLGALGLWYLIKNSEWAFFDEMDYPMEGMYDYEHNRPMTVRECAQFWINQGIGLSDANGAIHCFKDVINSFNDLMDDIVLHKNDIASEMYAEWLFEDSDGVKKLKDVQFTFPNGCTIVIISGEQVMDFRLNPALTDWKGFWIPLGNADSTHIAMRLMEDPRFEIIIAGSEDWMYVDPHDGVVKLGWDCTPVQNTSDTELFYIVNWVVFFTFICDMLRRMGMFKTLSAWWQKRIMRQNFSKVRNMIDDAIGMIEDVHTALDETSAEQSDYINKYLIDAAADVKNGGDILEMITKLKKSMYKPYG